MLHAFLFLTSPQMPTVSLMSFLQYDSCRIQLLTATLLFPGARSSSPISTQPKERTAKHWRTNSKKKTGNRVTDSDTYYQAFTPKTFSKFNLDLRRQVVRRKKPEAEKAKYSLHFDIIFLQ